MVRDMWRFRQWGGYCIGHNIDRSIDNGLPSAETPAWSNLSLSSPLDPVGLQTLTSASLYPEVLLLCSTSEGVERNYT